MAIFCTYLPVITHHYHHWICTALNVGCVAKGAVRRWNALLTLMDIEFYWKFHNKMSLLTPHYHLPCLLISPSVKLTRGPLYSVQNGIINHLIGLSIPAILCGWPINDGVFPWDFFSNKGIQQKNQKLLILAN